MSDTENKTVTVDTAPYMKKDKKTESVQNNFAIPLVLLLLSAIVIFLTFDEDENEPLLAQTDIQAETTNGKQSKLTNATAETTEGAIAEQKANLANDEQVAIISANDLEITPQSETSSAPAPVDYKTTQETASIATNAQTIETVNQTTKNKAVSTESQNQRSDQNTNTRRYVTPVANTGTRPQATSHGPYQGARANHEQRQEQYRARVAHAQKQAKQYHEMMLQRRQAYEQAMQSRHQQYAAATKPKHEVKAEIFKAQQNRIAAKQKILEIHDRISALHNEIHQIMRETYPIVE